MLSVLSMHQKKYEVTVSFLPEEDLDCLEPKEGVPDIYEDDEARVYNETGLFIYFPLIKHNEWIY